MQFRIFKIRTLVAAMFCTSILVLATGTAWAQGRGNGNGGGGNGGGGGAAFTGVIYLKHAGKLSTMPADGSSAPEPVMFPWGTDSRTFEPSHYLHGPAIDEGDRWFAGVVGTEVRIADRFGNIFHVPGAEAAGADFREQPGPVRWVNDGTNDIGLSWFGIEYDLNGDPTAGLYLAELAWDGNGMPIITPAVRLFDVPMIQRTNSQNVLEWVVAANGHSWSPDASTVVVNLQLEGLDNRGALYTWNNPEDGLQFLIADGTSPEWSSSPTVNKIAFEGESGTGIYTINPDGSDLILVASDDRGGRKYWSFTYGPHWSADGQSVMFTLYLQRLNNGSDAVVDVMAVSPTGGSESNLTSDVTNADGLAWR